MEECLTDYFGEKSQQISPNSITAFGIDIISRYGNAEEIIQMINFAKKIAISGISNYVSEIFYDSKANQCSLKLAPSVKADDPIGKLIYEAASTTISQFDWFGEVSGTLFFEDDE